MPLEAADLLWHQLLWKILLTSLGLHFFFFFNEVHRCLNPNLGKWKEPEKPITVPGRAVRTEPSLHDQENFCTHLWVRPG